MIELCTFRHNDVLRILPFLHPVSRAEIASNAVDIISHADHIDEIGTVTSGYTPDGKIVFIAGSYPLQDNYRGTMFIYAKNHDRLMGFALRSWAMLEKKRFPEATFIVHSDSDHPLKTRFLAVAGCEHRFGPVFAVPA